MRITAGRAKGRKVRVAGLSKKSSLRPSAAKVREALFDIIGPGIEGACFLDLYAGTGAVGVEALSRGAKLAVFVESDPVRAGLIRRTAEEFGFAEQARIFKMTVLSYLKKASKADETFDFIFADPPYRYNEHEAILEFIGTSDLLADEGIVIVEHSSRRNLPESTDGLVQRKRYRYGDTSVTTYTGKEHLIK